MEPDMIGRMMPTSEIVALLGDHGCQDVTSLLNLSTASTYPIARGGLGDVYRVELYDSTKVAVKTPRIYAGPDVEGKKHLKRAARELHSWAKLDHPNVVKLIGLAIFQGQIGMVSLWMENGSLPTYLSNNLDADRWKISMQVSEGLAYLHTRGVVHGDLKGLNILVSANGTPVLTDFGNAVLNNQSLLFTTTTSQGGISFRWTAPELLESKTSVIHTQQADVYALGMTILETITGRVPYSENPDMSVMFCVMNGSIPNRPQEILPRNEQNNMLWWLLTCCWTVPGQRPSAAQVVEAMKMGLLNTSAKHHLIPAEPQSDQSPPGTEADINPGQEHSLRPGVYILQNVAAMTAIDLRRGYGGEDIDVIGFPPHGTSNQQWRLEWTGIDSNVTLQSVKSGAFISFKNFASGVGVKSSTRPQQWRLNAAGIGYTIEPADHRGHVLDLGASGPTNAAAVTLLPNHGTDNQKWIFWPKDNWPLGLATGATVYEVL